MIRTASLLCLILIVVSLALSGCIDPGIPDTNNTGSTPMGDDVAPTPTPTPTLPTTGEHYAPTPEPPAESNDTDDDPSTWAECDDRHNESWKYKHGCGMYSGGGGGSGSGSGGNTGPPPIVPELATCLMIIAGILVLAAFCWRK